MSTRERPCDVMPLKIISDCEEIGGLKIGAEFKLRINNELKTYRLLVISLEKNVIKIQEVYPQEQKEYCIMDLDTFKEKRVEITELEKLGRAIKDVQEKIAKVKTKDPLSSQKNPSGGYWN